MENKKTNVLAIIGFVLSFFCSIASLIISFIALAKIKENNEKGKGFVIAAIVICVLKFILFFLLIFLFSYIIWPTVKDNIDYTTKCSLAQSCEYNKESSSYDCIYINDDGVEEYITCSADLSGSSSSVSGNTNYSADDYDDEDMIDAYNYDYD